MLKADLVRAHTGKTPGIEHLKPSDSVKEIPVCERHLAHQNPEYIENQHLGLRRREY